MRPGTAAPNRLGCDPLVLMLSSLLKAAGVKTLRTLYKGAQSVFLDLQDGVISIDSWKYRYAGHWEGIRGLAPITVPESVGDIEFGQAIRAGLAKSF